MTEEQVVNYIELMDKKEIKLTDTHQEIISKTMYNLGVERAVTTLRQVYSGTIPQETVIRILKSNKN